MATKTTSKTKTSSKAQPTKIVEAEAPADLNLDAIHPKSMYPVYYLGAMPHVPHYRIAGVYVAPGGFMRSIHELIARGAVNVYQPLWTRG